MELDVYGKFCGLQLPPAPQLGTPGINAMDGGVFVVSGRTAAYRTEFLRDRDMLARFSNEKFFFGIFGGGMGLGPDDDNFLTRDIMKKSIFLRFQDTPDATIETTLGEWPKFRSQLLRWARTTFRSNPVMLRDPEFFKRYTWSYFMVYIAGITNFALIWDPLLVTALAKSDIDVSYRMAYLLCWIVWSKTVKLWPHFIRYPADLLLMPVQIAFGYIHSIIKLWALLTYWDCDWSGRRLDDVNGRGMATGFEPIDN